MKKIFGREPALFISLITSVLAVVVTLNLDFLNAGQSAAIVALLGAVTIALTTRPIAPAMFTGILTTAVALGAEYGLHLQEATVAALTVLVLNVCVLLGVRPQVEPKETAVSSR